MISSKADYRNYLQADKSAFGIKTRFPLLSSSNSMIWLTDPIWKWVKLLRKLEYWENCHDSPFWMPYRLILRCAFQRSSVALGFSIPINTCGPGLCILHYGSIVISRHASLGANCTLNSGVNIGMHRGGGSSYWFWSLFGSWS